MSKQLFLEGMLIEIPQGQTEGYAEIELENEIDLHGVHIFPQMGTIVGDIGVFEIIHPSQGVVGSYSRNAYISPKVGEIEVKVERIDEDPANLSAGLKLRFTYTAVDSDGRKCIVWLRVRK